MTSGLEAPPAERFLSKIQIVDSGCWDWMGHIINSGYGQFGVSHHHLALAHRFSYGIFNGVIPIGLEIDHLCRNRKCVNPDHLEVVTHSENAKRGNTGLWLKYHQLAKTHCPNGHPYDEINTYHRPDGGRDCKICRLRRSREYQLRRKVEK